ncbi:serine hydrolase [Sphingomonas sp. URHD0057]|uniref:serine hydrolase n=1 Tax=Sphingomonas sp. URHD0057 TaxID=1380389 RepID=UPI00048B382C|nr:serine hydrolase [Sphingomonas sp. URHD0057]
MTSRRVGLALVLLAGAQVDASAAVQNPVPRAIPPRAAPVAVRPATPAPNYIRDRVEELGRAFDGRVGIAVRAVDDNWATGWKADEFYPQQSVSKLWVSITAMDAVDQGRVRLDDKVTLTRSDLTVFHQPIRSLILEGGYSTTLADLMVKAITTSDNTANDKLMRSVGGPTAVREMIHGKHLGAIRFYDGERALQSRIAGLIWSPSYSFGNAFFDARDALPRSVRQAAFNRYVDDPYDGAAPSAIAAALARLKRNELLSPASTARLLDIMSHTKTGANRLKGGLQPGWVLNHKTGTGQELDGYQAGYNDIGILTAPDGRSYSVAVMIKLTKVPLPTRMALMNNVVRAVIAQHDMQYAAAAN